MLQSILQGESIPKIATRLSKEVGEKNRKAAIRNARTMATGAQNAGRYDAYRRADKMGIDLTIEWAAVLDNRTRHDHRLLHGQRRDVDEPFEVDGIEILYPGQTAGSSNIPQQMIWNCRCTLLAWVKGFEHDPITESSKMDGKSFEEWQNEKARSEPINSQEKKGEAIRRSYINEYRRKAKSVAKSGNSDKMKSEGKSMKTDNIVLDAISAGTVKDDINYSKQNRHIKGTQEYSEGKSYIYGDGETAKNLYNTLKATGTAITSYDGRWTNKERVKADENIGVYIDPISGEDSQTKSAIIHYSKTGSHIVPGKERTDEFD